MRALRVGELVTLVDLDNGTSYAGTVVAVRARGPVREALVEWHEALRGEDPRNWINESALRGALVIDAAQFGH